MDGSDSASFGYDGLHRLSSATGLWGNVGYLYDAFNNLRNRTGAGPLSYAYDASNRLSSITVPPLPTLTLSASPTTITSGSSTTLTWSSTNTFGCTASGGWSGSKAVSGSQGVAPTSTSTYALSCTGPGGSVSQQVSVTVAANPPTLTLRANPVNIASGGSSTLTWSSTNASACIASGAWSGARATSGSVTVSPVIVRTFTYTLTCTGPGGSVTQSASVTVTGGACRTCKPQTADPAAGAAVTQTAAVRQYSYDAQGHITADGPRSYTWNQAGEITQIPGLATYAYDAQDKRIKVTKSDGTIEYALYDLSGALVYTEKGLTKTDYLDLNGQPLVELANGVPTYLHPDLLGSPRAATSAAKVLLWREHYDPYGQKLNGVQDKLGYTGHAYDAESNLTYMQARFYDAQVGRFLSSDPQAFNGSAFSFNRYAYGNDNPYRYTDPTGLATTEHALTNDVPNNDGIPGGGAEVKSQILLGTRIRQPSGSVSSSPVSISPGPAASSGNQGGGGTSAPSSNSACDCTTPQAPPGVSVDNNIALVQGGMLVSPPITIAAMINAMRSRGEWDYKYQFGSHYRDFGNFNYGAVLTAVGFPSGFVQDFAGFYQTYFTQNPSTDNVHGGDSQRDNDQIRAGICYAENCR